MLLHLSAFLGFVIPFGNLIGPLVMWLLKKENSGFIDRQGKEAVNFQISVLIYAFISLLLVFVLIGLILLPALIIIFIVCIIKAATRATEGKKYRYPLSIRFL